MDVILLLVALCALALANLLVCLLARGGGKIPQEPCERRRPLLDARQARSLRLLDQVAGDGRRVQARVPLGWLIQPGPGVSARRARRWQARMGSLYVDFAILSADGAEPLCAVILTSGGRRTRRQQRAQARLEALCRQARLPMLSLADAQQETPVALRAQLDELIWPLEQSLVVAHPVATEDEDALLAALAVTLRDRSLERRPSGR